MNVQRADNIRPITPGNLIFNEVEIDATAPIVGQTLLTTSATTAEWANQAFGAPADASYLVLTSSVELTQDRVITFTGEFSVVDGGPNSSLTASLTILGTPIGPLTLPSITINNSSNTAKGRLVQDNGALVRSGAPYLYTRARALEGFALNPPEATDTIDGITLNVNDFYLVVNQVIGQLNGVREALAGTSADVINFSVSNGGEYVYVREGTEGANSIYVPTFFTGIRGAICTEAQARGININNLNDIPSTTISAEPSKFIFRGGTYSTSSTYTITLNGTCWEGQGVAEISQTANVNTLDIQANDVSIKNMTFSSTIDGVATISIGPNAQRIVIQGCVFNDRVPINILGGSRDIIIQDCTFNPSGAPAGALVGIDLTTASIQGIQILNCQKPSTSIPVVLLSPNPATNDAEGFVIQGCSFTNTSISTNATSFNWSIKNNSFFGTNGTSRITIDQGGYHQISGNIIDGNGTLNNGISGTTTIINTISQNVFQNFLSRGIFLQTQSFSNTISDNVFDGTFQMIELNNGTRAFNSVNGNEMTTTTIANPIVITTGLFEAIQKNNIELTQTIGTSPTTINGYVDRLLVAKTVDPLSLTLDDLVIGSAGHIIYVEADSDTTGGGPPVFDLTYTQPSGGGPANVDFNVVGANATFRWDGDGWVILSSVNVV